MKRYFNCSTTSFVDPLSFILQKLDLSAPLLIFSFLISDVLCSIWIDKSLSTKKCYRIKRILYNCIVQINLIYEHPEKHTPISFVLDNAKRRSKMTQRNSNFCTKKPVWHFRFKDFFDTKLNLSQKYILMNLLCEWLITDVFLYWL